MYKNKELPFLFSLRVGYKESGEWIEPLNCLFYWEGEVA